MVYLGLTDLLLQLSQRKDVQKSQIAAPPFRGVRGETSTASKREPQLGSRHAPAPGLFSVLETCQVIVDRYGNRRYSTTSTSWQHNFFSLELGQLRGTQESGKSQDQRPCHPWLSPFETLSCHAPREIWGQWSGTCGQLNLVPCLDQFP